LLIRYRYLLLFFMTSVADPDPRFGAFLTPESGIREGRKSGSGFGIRDEQPGSYFLELTHHLGVKILKFEDPGWKKVGSGINFPDPPHYS
jgi:hypothetical protein